MGLAFRAWNSSRRHRYYRDQDALANHTGHSAYHGCSTTVRRYRPTVGAFWTRNWSGFFLILLMGVLYVVLGLLFVRQPVQAAEALTLLLACALMASGAFRIVGSL